MQFFMSEEADTSRAEEGSRFQNLTSQQECESSACGDTSMQSAPWRKSNRGEKQRTPLEIQGLHRGKAPTSRREPREHCAQLEYWVVLHSDNVTWRAGGFSFWMV